MPWRRFRPPRCLEIQAPSRGSAWACSRHCLKPPGEPVPPVQTLPPQRVSVLPPQERQLSFHL